MVLDQLREDNSAYGACKAIGPKLGGSAESLRLWTRQAQIDANRPPGATTEEQQRIKELERETRDLEEANKIQKIGIDFFARELLLRKREVPPAAAQIVQFIDQMRAQNYWVESICRVLTEHGMQVAPRAYRNRKSAPPSARPISDAYLIAALRETVGEPEERYGRRKMFRHLRRKG